MGGWQNYKRGVYTRRCSGASGDLDHCVQLVGYDKSGPTPYWIVRNSWNADWGINGYMHLKMGENLCGVADDATIATIATEGIPAFGFFDCSSLWVGLATFHRGCAERKAVFV